MGFWGFGVLGFMKRKITALFVLIITVVAWSAPLLAEMGGGETEHQSGEKNECLLTAMNCGNQSDTIQQRIHRLEREVSRGRDVYTDEELQRLRHELDDANKLYNYMIEYGGAS